MITPTVATVALLVLDVIKHVPEAVGAVQAWFHNNPNATPEEAAAELATYQQAVADRRAEVAKFNEDL